MDKIMEVLTKGVEKIYPSKEELEKVLRSGNKIKLYNGIDPTGPQLHLGHMVVLKKLRQFQNLGHQIILLIGDFTGRVGDPSGKTETRKQLTKDQILENAKTYKEQLSKILNFEGENPVEIRHNSEWLESLGFVEFLKLASQVTYSQLIQRDMFQKRMKEGRDLFVNELLYPLLQGYDSVELNIDLEVGGSDQTFNMLMGRTLMKKLKRKDKFVLATKLLAEPGKEKMGKTEGNLIALTEKSSEMFGKIMSWPDEMISLGFELLTDVPLKEITSNKTNPMDLKKKLAWEIVVQLHSKEEANKAQEEFERVFQKRETPFEIPIYKTSSSTTSIIDLLFESRLVPSRSEAKRLVEQGAVEIDGQTVTDIQYTFQLQEGMIIKAGKRRFIKIGVL